MKRKNFGFTLVELLVVIAIGSLILGVGGASLVNTNEKQVITQSGLDFKNFLQYAQAKADSGEKLLTDGATEDGCLSEEELYGWCFSPNATNREYTIYGSCEDKTNINTAKTFNQTTYKLPRFVDLLVYSQESSGGGWSLVEDANLRTLFQPVGEGALIVRSNVHFFAVRYCLKGSLPSLGAQDTYVLEVQQGGEIIDYGLQEQCDF